MLPDCLTAEGEQRCRQLLAKATAQLRVRPAAAAVLVPLCSVRGVPALLYTLRSSRLAGRHKGDVSFPGGKCDPTDQDVVHTALRETHEELGLAVPEDHVWGILRPVYDQSHSPAKAMPPLTTRLAAPGKEHRGAGACRCGPRRSPEPQAQPGGGAEPRLYPLLPGWPLPLHNACLPPRATPCLGDDGHHHRVHPAAAGTWCLPAPPIFPWIPAQGLKTWP
ncbi:mitochondrial coenzyme A diphosphatase NUDT8 isoform 2-T2 [Glossophaga mutica]